MLAVSRLKCPPDVKEELENYMPERKSPKRECYGEFPDLDDADIGDDDDEDAPEACELNLNNQRSKRDQSAGSSSKKTNLRDPIDLLFMKQQDKASSSKCGKLRQTSMRDTCDKEARAITIQYIARFFYQAGHVFNAVTLDSFKNMIEAIGRYSPGLKPPSIYEMRLPLLKKELKTKWLENNKRKKSPLAVENQVKLETSCG